MRNFRLWEYLTFDWKSIRGKITWGFLGMGTITAFLTLIPISTYQKIIQRYDFTFQNTVPTSYYCSLIEVCISQSNSSLDNYLLTGNNKFKQDRKDTWEFRFKPALDSLLNYTKTWKNNAAISLVYDVSIMAARLKSEQEILETDHYEKSFNEDFALTQIIERRDEDIKKLDLLSRDITRVLDKIIDIQKEEIDHSRNMTKVDESAMPLVLFGSLLMTAIVGVLVAISIIADVTGKIRAIKYNLKELSLGNLPEKLKPSYDELDAIVLAANRLDENLKMVKWFANEVGQGNFDATISSFKEDGELGLALNQMRDSLKKVSVQDSRRAWTSTGLARFAKILRDNSQDIDRLCDVFIWELVKYLGASHGSIYLSDQNDSDYDMLTLKSTYAFDVRKLKHRNIDPGEGLLGEAYLEKRMLYLTDIPANYVSIKSGLGGATPACVLIVPLKVNEEVEGMLEIASFQFFEPYQLDFAEKVAESLASTLISVEINQKTRRLLENAQVTGEMMRAQEEEMRQNMEELQATQEELTRRTRDLDVFVGAINQSTLLVEIDKDGQISKVNDKFSASLQYAQSELSGMPFTSFMSDETITHNEEIQLWEQLKSNLGVEVEEKRVKKDGSTLWLHSTYIPVISDETGRLEKIVCICTDATREMSAKMLYEKSQEEDRAKKEEALVNQRILMDKLLARSREKEKKYRETIFALEKEVHRLGAGGTSGNIQQQDPDNDAKKRPNE